MSSTSAKFAKFGLWQRYYKIYSKMMEQGWLRLYKWFITSAVSERSHHVSICRHPLDQLVRCVHMNSVRHTQDHWHLAPWTVRLAEINGLPELMRGKYMSSSCLFFSRSSKQESDGGAIHGGTGECFFCGKRPAIAIQAVPTAEYRAVHARPPLLLGQTWLVYTTTRLPFSSFFNFRHCCSVLAGHQQTMH